MIPHDLIFPAITLAAGFWGGFASARVLVKFDRARRGWRRKL